MDVLQLKGSTFSLDSETTGLEWQNEDTAFLWSVYSCEFGGIVFDLRKIDKEKFYRDLKEVLECEDTHCILFNAKFDLHMLVKETGNFHIKAKISDVQVLFRLLFNTHGSPYIKLSSVAQHYGLQKDETLSIYIKENRLYKTRTKRSGEIERVPCFDKVPDHILYKYASTDAEITYKLYFKLIQDLYKLSEDLGHKEDTVIDLISIEEKTTLVLLEMENNGVKCDFDYLNKSIEDMRTKVIGYKRDIENITGAVFVDSNKNLKDLFSTFPDDLLHFYNPDTKRYSFSDDLLTTSQHELSKKISLYRASNKKLNTYFVNYQDFICKDGRIRATFNQASTRTGRFSSNNPNMQNVPSVDEDSTEEEFLESKVIRDCFTVEEGNYFISLDYQAQEYRVLLDQAGQNDVIVEILKGLDIHSVAASLMGVLRYIAKYIGFGLLYGMGVGALSKSLKVTLEEATRLRAKYFSSLPLVSKLVKSIISAAEKRDIKNLYGRVYRFGDEHAYKSVNYFIQGTCADMMRVALINASNFIRNNHLNTRIILSIHDEICLEMPENELHFIESFRTIMKEAYKHTSLPMDTGVEIGIRWGSLEKLDIWQKKQKQDSVIV